MAAVLVGIVTSEANASLITAYRNESKFILNELRSKSPTISESDWADSEDFGAVSGSFNSSQSVVLTVTQTTSKPLIRLFGVIPIWEECEIGFDFTVTTTSSNSNQTETSSANSLLQPKGLIVLVPKKISWANAHRSEPVPLRNLETPLRPPN
jgi:hypothetical protein